MKELWHSQKFKIDYVVASLILEFAVEVRDLLKAQKNTHHKALKEQLIKGTTIFEQHKLQQIFTGEEFEDSKPTQPSCSAGAAVVGRLPRS